jgi:hypothetical protein
MKFRNFYYFIWWILSIDIIINRVHQGDVGGVAPQENFGKKISKGDQGSLYLIKLLVFDSNSEGKAHNIDNHESHINIKTKQINKDLSLINNLEVKQEIFHQSYRTSFTKKGFLKVFAKNLVIFLLIL